MQLDHSTHKKKPHSLRISLKCLATFFLIKALIIYFLDCNGTAWLTHTHTHTPVKDVCVLVLTFSGFHGVFRLAAVWTDCSPGAHRPLPDREGQPSRTAAPLHRAGPQTGVGALQRVCAHHQELHPHMHRHQTRVVSFSSFILSKGHFNLSTCTTFVHFCLKWVVLVHDKLLVTNISQLWPASQRQIVSAINITIPASNIGAL